MKLIIFTYNFPPDISAGAFRIQGLLNKLDMCLDKSIEIYVLTAVPNRYSAESDSIMYSKRVHIKKFSVPNFGKSFTGLAFAYVVYFFKALIYGLSLRPNLVIGTSSRFFTSFLSTIVALLSRAKLIIDLRDIFSESLKDNFSFISKILNKALYRIIYILECACLKKADSIVQVSPCFQDYFPLSVSSKNWITIMNGIDKIFLNSNAIVSKLNTPIESSVVYAGNIGIAQALHKIIPQLAKSNPKITFKIIGEGSGRKMLESTITELEVTNVKVLEPMSRKELLKEYILADVLFLHLRDIPAFKRVLPSKIFEYGSLNKPILAGVTGFMESFIIENFSNAYIFYPEHSDDANNMLENALLHEKENKFFNSFVNQYSRNNLLEQYSNEVKRLM